MIDGNVQEVSRLKQEAQYFRLGGLLAQLTETGPRLGVDGELIFLGSFFGTIFLRRLGGFGGLMNIEFIKHF